MKNKTLGVGNLPPYIAQIGHKDALFQTKTSTEVELLIRKHLQEDISKLLIFAS